MRCEQCKKDFDESYIYIHTEKDYQKAFCKVCAMRMGYMKPRNLTDILDETKNILTGERATSYGDSQAACQEIANYWNTYLGYRIRPESQLQAKDIPMMMILFKIVRENNKHKHDNLMDVIGYAAIADYIEER